MSETARPYTPTALPSVAARLLAFLAILVGGLCGGLIGWSVTDLQCGGGDAKVVIGATTSTTAPVTTTTTTPQKNADSGCTTWNAGGGFVGALVGAGGTAIVSVLVLRAMAEWRRDLDVDEAPDSGRGSKS
ncbi:MAG: hypothetical protein JWN29_846 [Acidimicrobiales bacterium]|nr:hypothetical protein [Acidimicrobiales bacterium]